MASRDNDPRSTRSGSAPGAGSGPLGARLVLGFGLLLAALTACQREPAAELLSVDAVLPGEAQFGDSMQILGDGFGLGSPAQVMLRGDVYRAGRAPEPIERSFRARTESQRELSLSLPRDAEAAFCGEPDDASHATFRGDVLVAIAAHDPGAPPATGTLHGVVLELYPAVKARTSSDRLAMLGRDVLDFVGIEVAADREGGLAVLQVAPGSRAAAADVRPGDRLVRAGGLSVLQPSDLVPEAARQMEIGVVRDDVEQSLLLDVDGFVPAPPPDLAWPAGVVLAVAAWLVLGATPLTRALGWIGHNWLEGERARRRALSREGAAESRREWPRWLTLMGGLSGVLVWLGVGAALSAPVLRRVPVDVGAGLIALMFVSAALLGAAAFGAGGTTRERWSMRRAFSAALCQWWVTVPAWVAVVAPCFERGIDLEDLMRAQGPWPWDWNAFENPGSLLACSALLATTLARPGPSGGGLTHARPPRLSWRGQGDGWFDRLYLCSASGVATLVFLGGDAWPGVGDGALLPAASAAMLLVVKYTLVVLGVSFARGLCLGLSPSHFSRLTTRALLPAACGAVLLAHAFRLLSGASPLGSWVAHCVGPASVAVVVLGACAICRRLSRSADTAAAPALSPWL